MTTLANKLAEIALCETLRFPPVRHVTHENYTQGDLGEANEGVGGELSVEELEAYFAKLHRDRQAAEASELFSEGRQFNRAHRINFHD